MKRIRVTHEAIVDDSKVKTEEDVIAEGFDDIEDAILTDGLDGVIDGSFEFRISYEIVDADKDCEV